jgi:hypothetical protein
MRQRLALAVGVVVAAALLGAAVAEASCIPTTSSQLRARADVIFDGIAFEGPTATGAQRFKVTRYLKGRGPTVVRVQTGHTVRPDGTGSTTSVAIVVRKSQRWRIFAQGSARRVLRTSVCDGSRRL